MPIDHKYVPEDASWYAPDRKLDTVLVSTSTPSSYIRIIHNGQKQLWIATASVHKNSYLHGKAIDQGTWMTEDDVRDLITVLEYALSLEAPDAGS